LKRTKHHSRHVRIHQAAMIDTVPINTNMSLPTTCHPLSASRLCHSVTLDDAALRGHWGQAHQPPFGPGTLGTQQARTREKGAARLPPHQCHPLGIQRTG